MNKLMLFTRGCFITDVMRYGAFPQGLKPVLILQRFAARLKSCPDTKPGAIRGTAEAVPFQNIA
jgi:hypothetical protein